MALFSCHHLHIYSHFHRCPLSTSGVIIFFPSPQTHSNGKINAIVNDVLRLFAKFCASHEKSMAHQKIKIKQCLLYETCNNENSPNKYTKWRMAWCSLKVWRYWWLNCEMAKVKIKNEAKQKKNDIPKAKQNGKRNDTTTHRNRERKLEKKASPSHSNSINQLVDFLVSSSLTFDNFQALHFNGTSWLW